VLSPDVNWDAIGVVVAAAALSVTSWTAMRGGRRTIVTYESFSVRGKVELLDDGGYLGSRVVARRITLTNRGSHVPNFRARIKTNLANGILSVQVGKTTTIDDTDVKISNEHNGIVIVVEELPAGEAISVDIFSRSDSDFDYDYVVGGGSKFRIKDKSDFQFGRFLIFFGGLVLIGVITSALQLIFTK
jgi:hypothetical protein